MREGIETVEVRDGSLTLLSLSAECVSQYVEYLPLFMLIPIPSECELQDEVFHEVQLTAGNWPKFELSNKKRCLFLVIWPRLFKEWITLSTG